VAVVFLVEVVPIIRGSINIICSKNCKYRGYTKEVAVMLRYLVAVVNQFVPLLGKR
jgi:hypothetical protein